MRFTNFQKSLQEINAINSDSTKTWKAGVNIYSDWTWEEFKGFFGISPLGVPQECSATAPTEFPVETFIQKTNDFPKSWDWGDKGVVTEVKNQGNCGSCYCFSASAALESQWAIKTGKLVNLAPQQFVDCAQFLGNQGCNGGIPSSLFESVRIMGGQMAWDDYPYHATVGKCQFNASRVAVTSVGSFNVTSYDEPALQTVVTNYGPTSVTYQVVSDFRHYTHGVYRSTSCKNTAQDVNHAVLATGYGELNGERYWKIKNSWGTSWGDQGYFLIARGENMCGIAACNSIPLV